MNVSPYGVRRQVAAFSSIPKRRQVAALQRLKTIDMQTTSERLDLLREALPYIQRFKNKIFVVKLSGKITENQDQLYSLAEEIALCQQVGIHIAVVHGGGKQLTAIAERLGISQRIVNGRRVTDAETLEVAKMVFAGQINTDILSALRRAGAETVGMSGVDGNTIKI